MSSRTKWRNSKAPSEERDEIRAARERKEYLSKIAASEALHSELHAQGLVGNEAGVLTPLGREVARYLEERT